MKDYFGPCSSDNSECLNPRTLSEILDAVTAKVTDFGGHPVIVAWNMNDEVCPACLEELTAGYQKIRELDENHERVWSVHWNWQWLLAEKDTTDIVGIDSYPINNLPITAVSNVAERALGAGKPLWLAPQIFNWADYPGDSRAKDARPPTKEEMRAMTYLAINHGAKGLIYYSYFNIRDDIDTDPDPDVDTSYEARWPQIKAIAREVDFLRPVLLSTDETNVTDVTCTSSDIDLKLMRQGFAYYLFAVNEKDAPLSGASFQSNLPDKPHVVDVLFEGMRQRPASMAEPEDLFEWHFTDDFDSYAVHVYVWTKDGDVYCDGRLNLSDAIVASQAVADLRRFNLCRSADVNNDAKIGLSELIYILQYVADLR
jgi:hypothetical protein